MKMKSIYLASLLSMGILSVPQSAQAFKPGSPAELKAEAKVEAKIVIYRNKEGKPAGFKFVGFDPILAEDILENAFDYLDKNGAVYTSEDGGSSTEESPPNDTNKDPAPNPDPDEAPPSHKDPEDDDDEVEAEPAYKDGGPVGPGGGDPQ